MADKYNNKYRISSIRFQNWDYAWDGAYFITICTQNREHFFGTVVNKYMELSPVGVLANLFWYEIKNHTKRVELGAFVVMPDHIHGVVNLTSNPVSPVKTRHALSPQSPQSPQEPNALSPQQQHALSSQRSIGQQRYQNQGKNTISSIIGSYKSAVTRQAHCMGINFAWQSRFYEHIICDEKSYDRIKKYIIENPMEWNDKKCYSY